MATVRFLVPLALACAACGGSGGTRPPSTDGGEIGDAGVDDGLAQDSDASPPADAELEHGGPDAPALDATHLGEVALDGRDERLDAPATLLAIELTPAWPSAVAGAPYKGMLVTARYSDGSALDVTRLTTFSSSDSTIVEASGSVLVAVAQGTVTITATYDWRQATVTMTVTPAPPMVGLTVVPDVATARVGEAASFSPQRLLADGTTQFLPKASNDLVQWSTSDATVAVVDIVYGYGAGQIRAISVGAATVTVTYDGFTASALLTVTNPTPTAILITPESATIRLSQIQRYGATLIYDDQTTAGVTNNCTWTSSNPSVAGISNMDVASPATMGGGLANPVSPGTTTITATYHGITATTLLTVTD